MAASNNNNKTTQKQQSIPRKNAPNSRRSCGWRGEGSKSMEVIVKPWLKTKALVKHCLPQCRGGRFGIQPQCPSSSYAPYSCHAANVHSWAWGAAGWQSGGGCLQLRLCISPGSGKGMNGHRLRRWDAREVVLRGYDGAGGRIGRNGVLSVCR